MSDAPQISALIGRAQAGDAEAFGEIYDAYVQPVYRFVLAQVRQPADAEDLTQQVFLKLIGSLGRYEDRGLPFGAWLFRIARNMVIDFGRTTRASNRPLDDSLDPSRPATDERLVEDMASERADIRAALAGLSREQRDVILLRFFAGLPPREIGLVLGKREGSVRALQFRALASLRRRLGNELVLDPATGEVPA